MYRKDVKVIDCTIRDGGLINKWQFSPELVKKVFQAVAASGVDYMELGYRASRKMFDPAEFGLWRFTTDDVVREIVGDTKTDTKLGVMVDIGRIEPEDIKPASESPLSFIRVATYLKDIDKAIALANEVHEKGYESFINIMAISTCCHEELAKGLKQIDAETSVSAVSIVDSYGALYAPNLRDLINLYQENLTSAKVGIHMHNNQQLGFANTLEGYNCGATYLDATINGIGRGAGNCPLELLLGFLKNPQYNIEPIFQVLEEIFVDLRNEIEWGYLIPYMITGFLNEHPRPAMALRADTDKKDQYVDFFRQITMEDNL